MKVLQSKSEAPSAAGAVEEYPGSSSPDSSFDPVDHSHSDRGFRSSVMDPNSDDDRDIDIESDEEDVSDTCSVGSAKSSGSKDGDSDDHDDDARSRRSGGINTENFTQAEKRAHHNALERKRRDHIKDSFNNLRESVPSLAGDKSTIDHGTSQRQSKASRAQILRKASEYIQNMHRKNTQQQENINDLRKQNQLMNNQILKLEEARRLRGQPVNPPDVEYDALPEGAVAQSKEAEEDEEEEEGDGDNADGDGDEQQDDDDDDDDDDEEADLDEDVVGEDIEEGDEDQMQGAVGGSHHQMAYQGGAGGGNARANRVATVNEADEEEEEEEEEDDDDEEEEEDDDDEEDDDTLEDDYMVGSNKSQPR